MKRGVDGWIDGGMVASAEHKQMNGGGTELWERKAAR